MKFLLLNVHASGQGDEREGQWSGAFFRIALKVMRWFQWFVRKDTLQKSKDVRIQIRICTFKSM